MTVLAATDIGVFRTTDGGNTWAPFNLGVIPAVAVFDIEQNLSGVVFAATHGRGIFELSGEGSPGATPVATPTAAASATGTPTPTSSITATATRTGTPSPTGTPTPSSTPTATATPTATSTRTATATATSTATATVDLNRDWDAYRDQHGDRNAHADADAYCGGGAGGLAKLSHFLREVGQEEQGEKSYRGQPGQSVDNDDGRAGDRRLRTLEGLRLDAEAKKEMQLRRRLRSDRNGN